MVIIRFVNRKLSSAATTATPATSFKTAVRRAAGGSGSSGSVPMMPKDFFSLTMKKMEPISENTAQARKAVW